MKVVDIETTGLDFNRNEIILTGVDKTSYINGQGYELPDKVAGHNFKFDSKFLTHAIPAGARDNRWFNAFTFDTYLAAALLTHDKPEKLSLDACAAYYLNVETWKELDRKKMASYPIAEVAEYCLKDVSYTAQLIPILQKKLKEQGLDKFYDEKIMPAARLLAEVEYRGMRIDVPATGGKLADINQQLIALEESLNTMAGQPTNWRSPKQVMPILKARGINPECYDFKKRAVVESTRDEALQPHKHDEIVQKLLKHRELTKLSGYLEGWLEAHHEGRIHPTYNMANTRTGRLSCSEPNLQQVPRDKSIRSLFVPSDGKCFVIADYAQIEPRIAAHYSQDENLLKVFTNKEDFYGSIAVNVLGVKCAPNDVKRLHPEMRQVAKVIGLSILYGIGPKKLADFIKLQAGMVFSKVQCQAIIEDYFRAYPGLLRLRQYVEKKVYEKGVLTNHYGRKILISKDDVFAQGVNSLIQSSASDACLFAQLKFANHPHAKLVALIHDEIIYEIAPEHADAFGAELRTHMLDQNFGCPLELEYSIGKNWGDKK